MARLAYMLPPVSARIGFALVNPALFSLAPSSNLAFHTIEGLVLKRRMYSALHIALHYATFHNCFWKDCFFEPLLLLLLHFVWRMGRRSVCQWAAFLILFLLIFFFTISLCPPFLVCYKSKMQSYYPKQHKRVNFFQLFQNLFWSL